MESWKTEKSSKRACKYDSFRHTYPFFCCFVTDLKIKDLKNILDLKKRDTQSERSDFFELELSDSFSPTAIATITSVDFMTA